MRKDESQPVLTAFQKDAQRLSPKKDKLDQIKRQKAILQTSLKLSQKAQACEPPQNFEQQFEPQHKNIMTENPLTVPVDILWNELETKIASKVTGMLQPYIERHGELKTKLHSHWRVITECQTQVMNTKEKIDRILHDKQLAILR